MDTLIKRTTDDVWITFSFTEGEPVRVRGAHRHRARLGSHGEQLLLDLPLKVGMPFDRNLLLVSADTLQTRLRDRGYPTASVFLSKRDIDRAGHTADLGMLVVPGQVGTIGSIRVSGTKQVDTSVVVSLLATRPGQQYRQSDIYSSQLNLYRSDLFRFASVRLDTAVFKVGDREVPLAVDVEEGPFHRARASAGFATNDCFRTSLGWTARNFLGGGQVLDLTGQLSKIGVGKPLDFGLEKSALCRSLLRGFGRLRAGQLRPVGGVRRPAFSRPRTRLRSRSSRSAGASSRSISVKRWAPASRSRGRPSGGSDLGQLPALLRPHPGQRRELLRVLQRLPSGGRPAADPAPAAGDPHRLHQPSAGQQPARSDPRLAGHAGRHSQLAPDRVVGVQPVHPGRGGSGAVSAVRRRHRARRAGSGRPIVAPKLQLAGGASNFIPPDQRFYAGGANDVRGFDRNELGPVVYTVLDRPRRTEATRTPPTSGLRPRAAIRW